MENKYTRLKWLALIIIAGFLLFLAQAATAGNKAFVRSLINQQEVQGRVTDQEGVPLIGVTVMVKGSSTGTITNLEGVFQLPVPKNSTLVFSFLGYKTLEVHFNGDREIKVSLEEDITALGEVEINAGYYSVKERERTGNISRITSEQIEKQQVTNPLSAMQGQMAGVQISQTTGVPGGGFDIEVRGRNSIREGGSNPLFVVDGVPYSSETLGSYRLSGSVLPGAGSSILNSLNPGDIKSIEVLKDADATAIYGSRGANGVVLITTKQGHSGKSRLTAEVSSGFGKVSHTLNLMNTEQYLEMRREAFANDGISEYPSYAPDVNGTWDQSRYTDWQKKFIGGTAVFTNAAASISGGDKTTRYLLSGGYQQQGSVFIGDFSYSKASSHLNVNHNSSDGKFNMSFSGSYVADKNDLPSTDLTPESQRLAPNAPELYDEEGNLNWANSSWNNPIRLILAKYLSKTNNLIANSVISYELGAGINAKVNLGFSDIDLEETRATPSTVLNPAYGLGSEVSSLYLNNSNRKSWIIEPQLSWEYKLGNGELSVLAGTTFQEQQEGVLIQYASGFSTNSLIRNIGAANRIFVLANENSVYKYHAVFGRINYNLKDTYFINLTGRRDGSSRFGPGKRFANFGALGAAWIFTEENFFKGNKDFLSFGKLRGSYGVTGNDQIGDYQFLDTYTTSGSSYQGVSGISPTRLFNPDFGWETNKKLELGLQLGFLKDRISLETSYYKNRSSNQLVGIPLPGTTGFNSIQANLDATVQNTGLEFQLNSIQFDTKNFRWSTSLNLSFPRNKLVSFPNLEGSTYANQYVVGEPLNILKLFKTTGIDPETGIYGFVDFNQDGEIRYSDDRQITRVTNPDFYGGISNSVSYKGWQLDFLLNFSKQDGVNYLYDYAAPGVMVNQPVVVLDRWQKPGDNSLVQRYTSGSDYDVLDSYYNYASSNAAISDASFLRLKNLSLSYDLPNNLLAGMKARLYLRGQNVFTITNYLGMDPETQSLGNLPPLRIFTVGTRFIF